MNDEVIGIPANSGLRQITQYCEHELRRTRGAPRGVVASAANIELRASRADFTGDFLTYDVQVEPNVADQLRAAISADSPVCRWTDDHTLRCEVPDPEQLPALVETLQAVSAALTLPVVWHYRGEGFRDEVVAPDQLLAQMLADHASDLHLAPGMFPMLRIDGEMQTRDFVGPLSAPQILALLKQIAPPEALREFETHKQCSFTFHQVDAGYARVSAFVQSGKPHLTLRLLPERIPGFEELNLPADIFEELGRLQSGLVLVAGVTGSGKSTTVAALVDWINTNRPLHIITLEDPIEYRHLNRKSILSQRNVGTDVDDLPTAIFGALRQDPDIIVIGELRDARTIQAAINAASTGHLVIGTMHANTAADVVGRLLSFFAPSERDLVRLQLREALECVICQRLVPRLGGGRVPALELLFNDTSVMAEALVSGNASSVRTAMQQTLSRSRLFEADLKRLTQEKVIAYETGQAYATDTSVFEQMVLGTYAPPALDSMRYDYKG